MKENKKEILNKLNQLTQGKESAWKKEYEKRRANPRSLKRSQKVALQILRALRAQNLTQKDLADSLGVKPQQVNKWVKGKANFTFETIENIEDALGLNLMEVIDHKESQTEIHESIMVQLLTSKHEEVTYIRHDQVKAKTLKASQTNEWSPKRNYAYS